MKINALILLAMPALLFAQEAATPEMAPDTVVAVVNGNKVTADEIRKLVAAQPPQIQQAFANDPKQFMKEHAWYLVQSAWAIKQGLHERSPVKEMLEFQRTLTLVQAAWTEAHTNVLVLPEQQKAHYDKNQSKYREVQAKLIYLPFSGSAPEDEVKAKAEKVVKEARSGADFVKLVQEYSQDSASKAKNGDMGLSIRPTTKQIPEPMRNAILALQPGQVSDPIRHQNGYYVFRAESAGVLPFEKVKDEIYVELKDIGFNEWKEKTKAESSVQFTNEAFFNTVKQQQQQAPQPPATK